MARTGVINPAGVLLRWADQTPAYDWTPTLLPGEVIRTDIPDPCTVRDQRGTTTVSRWNGVAWTTLPQQTRYIVGFNGPGMLAAAQLVTPNVRRITVVNGEVFVHADPPLTPLQRTNVLAAVVGVAKILTEVPL